MRRNPSWQAGRTAAAAARITLAFVFLAAALPKLIRPAAFRTTLAAWQLLPDWTLTPAALWLPWLEFLTGMALLAIRPLRRGALLWGGTLPILFACAWLVNRLRGIEAPCGCFSTDPAAAPAGWGHLALNVGLVALALAAARGETRSRSTAGRGPFPKISGRREDRSKCVQVPGECR